MRLYHLRAILLLQLALLTSVLLIACGSSSQLSAAPPAGAPAPSRQPSARSLIAPTSPPRPTKQPNPSTAPAQGHVRVHFIDVDQGDSILIQSPDGATMLIDGGYGGSGTLAYLQEQGIGRIDVMVASHPHADHIGGLIEVLRSMPVGAVWTSGASHTTATFEQFLDAIAAAKVPYHEAKGGDTIMCGSLAFAVLHSEAQASNLNDTSLVLHLQYQQVSFLFTGDAEQDSEEAMLREVPEQLRSTVLKVGHHGSSTSSSVAFLAAVQPKVAVYSAGRNNSYGHPHAETIRNLQAAGAQIYGTDKDGTVIVETDGATYTVSTSTEAVAQPQPTAQPSATAVPSTAMPPARPTATTAVTLRYDPNGPDRDCGDFATHQEAQAFFIAGGGPARDRHRLDGDNDGIACESLPR